MKARAVAKEAKAAPDGAAFVVAARAVQKAQQAARAQMNAVMDRALDAALAAMSAHAVKAGCHSSGYQVHP